MDFYTQKNNLDQRKSGTVKKTIPELENFKKNGFIKYEDPTGTMTGGQLRFAAWYAHNRIFLYRLLVGFLILFSACTIVYSLLRVLWIVIVDMPRDEKTILQLVKFDDYEKINSILFPQPVMVGDAQVYVAGVNKYDVMAMVSNPNTKHIVYFDYYFSVNGNTTERKSGFILPQESKPFADFGLSETYGAMLTLENISYKRINAHLYPDPLNFILARNLFEMNNFEFKSVLHPQGANANIIKFDLINASPFHYYEPHFIVEFRNNGATAGVAEIAVEKFESLQTKNIDLRSFADNLYVDEIAIYPSINYFERNEYFEPVR